ncbi:hypothetical protein LGK95_07265 [Clostridium algoriphilum]|uniref:hypothetical protein n=1 Tax=Clostridium algoriphilum TaxID=198347 RepID=UPI001CF4296C|nr:hypothetical protein [Clostridium algoriphilum]MCB2293318.1 hypothetical protein [Clostridium algoriphilum]
MKMKKSTVIVIAIVLGMSIVGTHLHNNKYMQKINIIEQNIKNEKFKDAENNIKDSELKEEDVKSLSSKIKKQKEIVRVKKDIESSFRYLTGISSESEKNSSKALMYAFGGYMKTINHDNIEKCKTLGISEYLSSQEDRYLSYLKDFGINENEVIRICKLKRYEKQAIIYNNKVVVKQIEANVEADKSIRKATSAESFE